ncbi:MAG TPA: YciI family protein [Thermoleophilaceae bacterium]|nr:YciI family protein [Thermoleophilaceae bacterium]
MADYYLVERVKGPAWDRSYGWREHPGWEEHAAFMDALTGEGFIVLGGPIGETETDRTLLIVDADDEAAVRARFAQDPWPQAVLAIASIRPWSLWLRAPTV